jgi:hypothetical protein
MDLTIEMIKEREEEIRQGLEKMLEPLDEHLRANIMGYVTALLVLGILEGRKTSDL